MKQILAMILAVTLVFGCVPVPVFAEETAETTEATETTAATTAPTEETVTEPTPVTITGISVAAYPAKTVYQTGESLDLTGGSVTVSYSDGTFQTVAMTAEMVSGFNNTAAFTQTLTVAYEGFEAYFDVTVTAPTPSGETEPPASTEETTNATEPSGVAYVIPAGEKEISWIELTTKPTKIQYVLNQDELDVTGGVITVYYTDGTEETVDITPDMVSGFDNSYVHTDYLSVKFFDYSTGYYIAVVESLDKPIVMDWAIDMGNSKTTYYQYESLKLDGVTLTLEYSNGITGTINVTLDMVKDFDTSSTGYYSFGIQYGDTTYWQGYNVITADMLSGNCGDNIYWNISDSGVLRITGSGKLETVAPEYYLDVPWIDYRSLIKTVIIEEGITSIGQQAFNYCKNLTTVSLPVGLVAIGDYVFDECPKLMSINFPSGLEEIGDAAFGNCISLTDIEFPQSLTSISWKAFYGCTGITEITFPKKLQYLGSSAFLNCTGLQTITFEGKESPSGVGDKVFENVTATGYYTGTTYWQDWFFENCGGNIEWIAVGEAAEGIKFYSDYYECLLTEYPSFGVESIPGYVSIDCEFAVDNDVVKVVKTSGKYFDVIPQKLGTAVITATDNRSGCTATMTIKVVSPQEINCPHEETIQSNSSNLVRRYLFTPVESGEYVLTGTGSSNFYINVAYTENDEKQWIDSTIMRGEDTRYGYMLEAGKTYEIGIECYSSAAEGQGNINVTFSLKKSTRVTGIEIVGGNREVYGVAGETFHQYGLYVNILPETAVGEIIWESSDPELISVYTDAYDYGIQVQGEGSAVLTAKCGEYSDSITVTTKKPQKLSLNTPVAQVLERNKYYYYSFTPEVTGRYAFEVESDIGYGQHWFIGKYDPTDMEYGQSDATHITYGTFTAGVTYYYYATGYDIGKETCTSIITIKKEEAQPVAIEVVPSNNWGTTMEFRAQFVPSNSYEEIVSWESSNTDILDTRYNYSDPRQSFSIYGSGEVTITAVSESGLRASCTVTVGQCYNGHTYGPWKQARAKTCTIGGLEIATCVCGQTKHKPIPATGHSYDHNCDTECNECGATRTANHDFGEGWLYSETAHWHICVNCGERSQIQNHIPGAAATQETPQTCTECGYVIKGALSHSHSYGTELTVDETGHWYACNGCNARKNYNAHAYTNVCDADCNDCGYTRKNVHVSGGTWVSDKAGHWQSCTKCNTKLNYAAHVPGAPATANTAQICSICRYEIQKATGTTTTNTVTQTIYQTVTTNSNHTHKYSDMLTLDEVGHWYACSGCTSKKEYAKHKFVNDCDADCDTCGYTRAVSHATEANWSADGTGHWYSCKDCGEKVGFAFHQAENGNCMICRHPATGSQISSATTATAEPHEVATTEPDNSAVINTNATEAAAKSESAGMPWWMMIVAGVVSSAGTLGIVAIVIWINRKKIVAIFMDK